MDSAAFDAWLAAIEVMSAGQRRKGAETLASAGAADALNAADVPASSGDTIVTCDDTAYDAIKGAIPEETATVTSPTPPLWPWWSRRPNSGLRVWDVRTAAGGGFSGGVAQAVCRVTVAVIASARSTR